MRLIVAVAMCIAACAPDLNGSAGPQQDGVEAVDEVVEQRFQFECPADVFPSESVNTSLTADDCRNSLDLCKLECEQGAADHCLAAAFAMEELQPFGGTSLFLKACRLGAASGCTNAAAHKFSQSDRIADECIVRSFKIA